MRGRLRRSQWRGGCTTRSGARRGRRQTVYCVLREETQYSLAGPRVHETREAKGAAEAVGFIEGFVCYSKSHKKPLKAYHLCSNKKHLRKPRRCPHEEGAGGRGGWIYRGHAEQCRRVLREPGLGRRWGP